MMNDLLPPASPGPTDLLVGYGEVGSALYEVLSERRTVAIHDLPKGKEAPQGEYQWLHICFPYSDAFIKDVIDYVDAFKPSHLVIHSTVPVGTCAALDAKIMFPHVIYSPVRGIHPDLARYLREFPKWFYAADNLESRSFQGYMAQAGIQTREAQSFDALELQKLWETTEYYVRIVMWQEIERQLLKIHPPWGSHTESYEKALSDMRAWLFEKRKVYDGDRGLCPIMYGGIVGGHCLVPNLELMKPLATPEFYAWLTKSNELRK